MEDPEKSVDMEDPEKGIQMRLVEDETDGRLVSAYQPPARISSYINNYTSDNLYQVTII